jgi:pyrroline-5-carboxylate reductase
VLQKQKTPAELRAAVTSPGGTTHAAITAFESGGFRELVKKALTAARDRSIELGR